MYSKKRVLLGIVIISIIVLSIVSVSAGFWSKLFGGEDEDLEGELAESFEVGVTMENQDPTITSWTVTSVGPTTCDVTIVPDLVVLITDPDGDTDLTTGVVTAQLSKLGETSRPQAGPTTCSGGDPNGNNILEFTCSIDMQYYDGAGNWIVVITATDGTSVATNDGQQSTAVGQPYPWFVYQSSLDPVWDDFPSGSVDGTIEWSEVTTTTVNAAADNHINILNCGNANIASTGIIAQNLDSQGSTSDVIEPNSFSGIIDDNTPCQSGGDQLNKPVSQQIIAGGGLLHASGAKQDLYFCLDDINPDTSAVSIEVASYTSTISWDITFT